MGIEWVEGRTTGIRKTVTKPRLIVLPKYLHSNCRKNSDKQIWTRIDMCDPCSTLFVGLNMCQ